MRGRRNRGGGGDAAGLDDALCDQGSFTLAPARVEGRAALAALFTSALPAHGVRRLDVTHVRAVSADVAEVATAWMRGKLGEHDLDEQQQLQQHQQQQQRQQQQQQQQRQQQAALPRRPPPRPPSVGLVSLLLREVGIGIEGLTSLTGSLRHIPSLAKLSLYGNGITDRGAMLIADGVGPTSTGGGCAGIVELDLGCNSIGPLGLSALLCQMRRSFAFHGGSNHSAGPPLLGPHRRLTHLSVAANKIGDRGARLLARCLRHDTAGIVSVAVPGNSVSRPSALRILAAMPSNRMCLMLDIGSEAGTETGGRGGVAHTRRAQRLTTATEIDGAGEALMLAFERELDDVEFNVAHGGAHVAAGNNNNNEDDDDDDDDNDRGGDQNDEFRAGDVGGAGSDSDDDDDNETFIDLCARAAMQSMPLVVHLTPEQRCAWAMGSSAVWGAHSAMRKLPQSIVRRIAWTKVAQGKRVWTGAGVSHTVPRRLRTFKLFE